MQTIVTSHRFISIAIGFTCILLLATFPGWHEETDETGSIREVKPFPSRPIRLSVCGMLLTASLLAMISSLWQHIAAIAFATTAQNMGYGSIKSEVGAVAMGLGWASLALYIVAFSFIWVMIRNMSILDELTDE